MATRKRAKKTRTVPWSRSPSVPPFQGIPWRRSDGGTVEVQTPVGMTIESSYIETDHLDQIMQVIWFPGGELRGWKGYLGEIAAHLDELPPSIIVLQWARYPEDTDLHIVRRDWIALAKTRIEVSLGKLANGCSSCNIRPTVHTAVWDGPKAQAFVVRHFGLSRGDADAKVIAATMKALTVNGVMLPSGYD